MLLEIYRRLNFSCDQCFFLFLLPSSLPPPLLYYERERERERIFVNLYYIFFTFSDHNKMSCPKYFFLYHKLLAPVGFIEAKLDLPLACYLASVFRFFIVMPRMFTFSLEYVENAKGYCC